MEDLDERPDRASAGSPVQPLATRDGGRRAWIPLALLAAVVAGAVLGSWASSPGRPAEGLPDPTGPAGGTGVAPSAAPSGPTPLPEPSDPYAELVVTCGYPSGWRAATLQHWIGRDTPIRTWTAEDPVPAAGPGDEAIPFAPVATDLVLAIGYCSPLGPEQPPQGTAVEIWAVPDDGPPVPLPLERLEPPGDNALGGLWLPPEGHRVDVDGRVGWRPGRYALRLVARSFDRWLGLDIEDITTLRSPVPGVGPGADPSAAATEEPATD